jgi:hypothetical protein
MYNAMLDMAMVRKQIYIETEQQRTLKKVARQTGNTEAGMPWTNT